MSGTRAYCSDRSVLLLSRDHSNRVASRSAPRKVSDDWGHVTPSPYARLITRKRNLLVTAPGLARDVSLMN